MTDLVKGVLGGARALIIGWIVPTFLSLQLIGWSILPSWTGNETIQRLIDTSVVARQATLLAVAAVFGLVLAAVKTPLYRILEGYSLWPQWLADRSSRHQLSLQRRHEGQSEKAHTEGKSIRRALLYEKALRFPAKDDEFAPTALGNAIRRFETYAGDRYNLDSQLLWHHLSTAAPDRLVKGQEDANTNVDFFICLIFGLSATTMGAAATLIFTTPNGRLWLALVMGVVGARVAYRLALIATDEWDSSVRAMVDHGRLGVAKAFGLEVPQHLADERDMWRAVNTLVRRPYTYSVSKDIPGKLDKFRIRPTSSPVPETLARNLEASSEAVNYNGMGGVLDLLRLIQRPWRKS
jgi:hypothetical protein